MSAPDTKGIAIIGMTGRFPGAPNVDVFWDNLASGVESISTFSDEELAASGLNVAALKDDPTYVPARGILPNAEWFDAAFFGMTANEAAVTDPQQRLLLEAAWEVLENAGYDPAVEDGLIGVYAGMGGLSYYLNHLHARSDLVDLVGDRVISLGNDKDYLATRIAYKLNLKGPALNINTACSTSLVAVCQACQGLLNYQCDLALAGGISLTFPQKSGVRYYEGGVFSPDGHCRPFDARAQGTVSSDGLGVVLLKRLSEAINDGDQVLAVIKGFGLNNDGSAKVGFTAPSVDGQAEAIAAAQGQAGFDPASISYVEAHGTATPLGDPIEIAALTQAFRMGTEDKNFCAIGSVKGNIGHLNSAAGIAGLIKTVLAMKNRTLPPSLHFTSPNPKIDFADSPFFVNSKLTEWKSGPTPRRAGVSSFGLGGTNAHVVLEEAPAPESSGPSRSDQLLLFSAKTASALDDATANFLAHLKANPDLNLADAAYTLQVGRRAFPYRRILVCRDVADAIQALEGNDPKRVITQKAEPKESPVAFMFPGQGAQYVNMGADLYRTEPVFQAEIDRCAQSLIPHLGLDLRHVLFPPSDQITTAEELLIQTRITQPALLAIEYALAKLWMSWGIKPQAMIGHSVGEYVAGCLAGVFTLEEALGIVAGRAQLVQAQPGGAMVAVRLPEKDVAPLLPKTLSIAAINSPSLSVVSGPYDATEAFEVLLKEKGIASRRLDTSHAFHSAMMDPVVEPLTKLLQKVKFKEPAIPYVSNVTAQWVTPGEAMDPVYWAKHVRQTVRFADGMGELLKNPELALLEVGPGRTLTTFANQHPAKAAGRPALSSFLPSKEKDQETSAMLTTLGRLWLAGNPVDWSGFYAHEKRRRISLPTYPFQRERYWIERQAPALATPNAAPQRNPDPADWFYLPTWKRFDLSSSALEENLPESGLEWLLFIEGGLGEKFAKSLIARRESVTRVIVGPNFERVSDGVYTINPERSEDYELLISDLGALGKLPRKIVHFWSVSHPQGNTKGWARLDRSQSLGLHSLLCLARALGEKNVSGKLDLEIISNNVHAVTGEEAQYPEKATILGAGKVIPLEYSNISCRCIDILIPESGTKSEQKLLQQLLQEFSTKPSEPIVAYRAGHRWIETYERIRLEPSGGIASQLKTNGVYLITGGLGGIGLALAEFLAVKVQAKLILIGRTALPPRDQWADWLAAHDDPDETSQRIGKIQSLENAGAEILVLAADVADPDRMREAIASARKRFGRIDGVIHAAGSADFAGMIQRRTKEATEEILAAKVKGTLVLDELVARDGLDFFVLCSTRGTASSVAAFGQVGYIAANEFLDAFAAYKRTQDDVYTVTINWDPWRDVGMAVWASNKQAEAGKKARVLTAANSLSPSEGAEAFNRILNCGYPRIVVSVADLDALRKSSPTTQQSVQKEEIEKPQTIRHARPEVETAFTAPTNELERALAGIWQEVFGLQEVGVDDNFFDLGGDSLLLQRVQVKIRQAFEVDLSPVEMFEYPTIGTLARRLNRSTPEPGEEKPADGRATVTEPEPIQDRALLLKAPVNPQRQVVKDDSNEIAIIGMSGRFPGAGNVDEFWRNLVAGVESASVFCDEELAASGQDVAEVRKNPRYVASRGIVENADWFDPAFFNINAKEAEVTDPQQRLFLEASWEALENAAYDPSRVPGYVGVFAGMSNNTYYLNNLHSHPELLEQVGKMALTVGNEKDYVATRIAYKLNLRGPALSTNTACSTSLVTVCMACQALLSRQCDLALAGGVSVTFPQKRATYYQEGGIFSSDGHCRPFDAQAAGTYFSDGLGVVVLKRLSEALKDGDQIYAVIKGVGLNNDGGDKIGFTAPGIRGQAEVIALAQAHAGVEPGTISYIEAHGTATPLGDPIEIAALTQAFQAGTSKKNFCAIGSVKGNIGHLDAAAGVAGLIKTALALKHKKLPATLHFTAPNPKIDFANSPFFVNSKLTEWKAGPTPRRAGVSAFGLGGTNAHVVLEEAPASETSGPSRSEQLLLFSAKTASALDAMTANFVAYLKANRDVNLADAAYTLQVGRRTFPYRRMLVCRDIDDAIQALETRDPQRVITQKADSKESPAALMLPGQGAQSDEEISARLTALGRQWLAGKPVDWTNFYACEQRRRISLPTYPFQRERYWIERRTTAPATVLPRGAAQQPSMTEPETANSQSRHARPEVDDAFAPPTSESEKLLVSIWQEAFGLREVGVDDNFFDLGGDSLLAVHLINKINKALPFNLSIPVFFQNPTVKKLATVFHQENHDQSESKLALTNGAAAPLVTFQAKGSRPPLFYLHGDWAGGGLYCGHLSRQMGEDQPFYALPPYRSGERRVLALEEMVAHHLAVIREHTPHGPYLLGGYCAGAKIAAEMARQLVEQGEEVSHLLLLDLPQGSAPWFGRIWPCVDKLGDLLKWDLLKKIHFFDRYPVALMRWLAMSTRRKASAIGRRLGFSVSYSPVTMGLEVGEYDEVILKSLDYAVYFLASCLYNLKPLSIPTTLYFAEETLPRSHRMKRASEIFPTVAIEMVPGNHLSCITKYASVVADKMGKTLGSL